MSKTSDWWNIMAHARYELKDEFPDLFSEGSHEPLLDFVEELVGDAHAEGYECGYLDHEEEIENGYEEPRHQNYKYCVICKKMSYRLIDNVCYYCG